jgi:hypothetical protein
MTLKARIDKLEQIAQPKVKEYHVEYPGERCRCDRCQSMTGEEYAAFRNGSDPAVNWIVVEYTEVSAGFSDTLNDIIER